MKNKPKPSESYAVYGDPVQVSVTLASRMFIVHRIPAPTPQDVDIVALFENRLAAEAFVKLMNKPKRRKRI